MKRDSIEDASRVVVGDVRHGGVLPGSRAEMWRDVFLLPGARVKGSVWGNRLTVEGPRVEVEEAVYVRGPLRVSAADTDPGTDDGGAVTFHSAVTSPDSVVVDGVPFRVRFLSSIYSGAVNLNRSIVYGNVYARSATLRDSIVLGGVYCKAGLKMENCAVSTFRARKAEIGRNVRIFFPMGMAEERMEFEHPVRALPFYDLEGDDHSEGQGAVTLDSRDVYAVDNERDGSRTFVLSMDERVLDTERLLRQFERNRRFLESLSMGRHLEPHLQSLYSGAAAAKLEDRLVRLLETEDVAEVRGSTAVNELFVRPSVLGMVRELASVAMAERLFARGSQPGAEAS